MTIESTLNKKIYMGNNLTRHFPIPFFVAEKSHIYLIHKDASGNSTPVTENFFVDLSKKQVEYPLTGTPLASHEELTVYRKVPLTQIVDLENAGAFHPKVLEKDGFDRVVMQIQQLAEENSRSVKVDINASQSASELLAEIFSARDIATEKAGHATQKAQESDTSAQHAYLSKTNAAQSEKAALASAHAAEYWAVADFTENSDGSAKYWALQASQTVPDATYEIKGKATFATQEEILAGENENKAVNSKQLQAKINNTITQSIRDTATASETLIPSEKAVSTAVATAINTVLGLPLGMIWGGAIPAGHIPDGSYPTDGTELSADQFPGLYADLEAGKIHSLSYAAWNSAVSINGSCSAFALDTVNRKFKVPKIADGTFMQSGNNAGVSYQAGLPNITGTIVGAGYRTVPATGAFRDSASISQINLGQVAEYLLGGEFNASYSNPIYGRASTVQPQSVTLRYFVVVSTGTVNQSLMDWEAWATGLEGKANKDLSNIEASSPSVQSLLGLSLPDWSRATTWSPRTSFTPSYDCMLSVVQYYTNGFDLTMLVDGKKVWQASCASGSWVDNGTVLLRKGVTYTFQITGTPTVYIVPLSYN